MILPIQVVLLIFIFFAITRVYLRVREGNLSFGGFMFWLGLFALAGVGVIDPQSTNFIANLLGIGRGADVVIYLSLVLLFYLIFRTNVMIENLRHEITKLVRLLALNYPTFTNPRKSKTPRLSKKK